MDLYLTFSDSPLPPEEELPVTLVLSTVDNVSTHYKLIVSLISPEDDPEITTTPPPVPLSPEPTIMEM